MSTSYDWIADAASLVDFCRRHERAAWVAFDTEFVSEYSYRPQLCLIQVATPSGIALIDPVTITDIAPFWEWLVELPGRVIVHAGRAEFEFCLRWTGRAPSDWFDVQLAAGLVATEYPISFRKLVDRFTGRSLGKAETRTDWRRRPLHKRQLEYACQDVVPLKTIADKLSGQLEQRGRTMWYEEEITAWRSERMAEDRAEGWDRMAGVFKLSGRQRAVARALWRWRESEAESRNILPRRVLRDDLVIELAKWETSDPKRIRSLRGMEW
ncbi:MAG TPA: ribonuclease D, partial [Planctomycetaceae bacterium]|nr:ribonuclease D [Planctomycetaceae bacterium]